MTYLGVNYLAVAIAAFAGYLFGAAWYMMLARPWLAASEFSPEQRARMWLYHYQNADAAPRLEALGFRVARPRVPILLRVDEEDSSAT